MLIRLLIRRFLNDPECPGRRESTDALFFAACYTSKVARYAHDVAAEEDMKKDIHPKVVPCKIIYQGQVVMETLSTKPEIHVEVWSGVHPFWTGETRFMDTEGRIDKFNKRFGDSYRRKK